jgi:hypothetical protein
MFIRNHPEAETDIERLTVELAGERTARETDRCRLAVARAVADKAMAELVALAGRGISGILEKKFVDAVDLGPGSNVIIVSEQSGLLSGGRFPDVNLFTYTRDGRL